MIQKAFTIGNSVAVTIPRKVGVRPGTLLKHLPAKKNIIAYQVVGRPQIEKGSGVTKFDRGKERKNYLKQVTGSLKLDMSTDEFMKIKAYCRDHLYEKL